MVNRRGFFGVLAAIAVAPLAAAGLIKRKLATFTTATDKYPDFMLNLRDSIDVPPKNYSAIYISSDADGKLWESDPIPMSISRGEPGSDFQFEKRR